MRDIIYTNRFAMDILPQPGSSDGISGLGIKFNGYRYATVFGMVGAPSDSDGTAVVRLQYATKSDIASDNASSDWFDFSADAVSATMTWATSDALNDGAEGFAIVKVDLVAHGLTRGCVRAQIVLNGTNTAPICALIALSNGSGGAQGHAVAVTPVLFP